MKFLISQNVEGLHIKSGVPADKIGELHGNKNLEYCGKCNYKFRNNTSDMIVYKNTIGRKCFDCKSELMDSIINFKENFNDFELDMAFDNVRNSDLMSPASDCFAC